MSPPIRDGSGNSIGSIRLGDGTEISEVRTGAGDVVFSGIPDSALTQDLVAWYRFEDGDARDYTATLDATFADSTAYDGTVNGATFQSNGGVTDFENGANSGAFDFDGSTDSIQLPTGVANPISATDVTVMLWARADFTNTSDIGLLFDVGKSERWMISFSSEFRDPSDTYMFSGFDDSSISAVSNLGINTGTYLHHAAVQKSNGDMEYYIDGKLEATASGFSSYSGTNDVALGQSTAGKNSWDGQIEDVRVYNRALTSSEISDIFNATKP